MLYIFDNYTKVVFRQIPIEFSGQIDFTFIMPNLIVIFSSVQRKMIVYNITTDNLQEERIEKCHTIFNMDKLNGFLTLDFCYYDNSL